MVQKIFMGGAAAARVLARRIQALGQLESPRHACQSVIYRTD